jgi:uncharacterized protein YrrD
VEKKAKQILGMPVVTFDRGTKIYDVQDMILDPQRRQVLALVVMEGSLFHSARAIPFGRISAIGQDAVIVPDGKAVIDVNRDPVLKKLDNEQNVRGLRVLTDDGRRLGYIEDITLDDKTGEIIGYDVSIGRVFNVTQGVRTLPADIVISTGNRVMYVPAAFGKQFDEQVGGWAGALDSAGNRIRTAGAKANAGLEDLGSKAVQATSQLKVGERAGEFALGKEAHQTVTSADGTVIVPKGELINQDHIDAARDANRLPQLLVAAGRGPAREQLGTAGDQMAESWNDIKQEARELWERLNGTYGERVEQADSRAVDRRIRNAVGRPVNRVILDQDDNVILGTGEIITYAAVDAARQAGVLDVLLSSVYVERQRLDLGDLRLTGNGGGGYASLNSQSSRPAARVSADTTTNAAEEESASAGSVRPRNGQSARRAPAAAKSARTESAAGATHELPEISRSSGTAPVDDIADAN